MNAISKWLTALALLSPVVANAGFTSVDGGLAVTDKNGLMWANTVGYGYFSATAAAGSAQAWVAGLNAIDYGGYSHWTLATGNANQNPGVGNATTNQLGELFFNDCLTLACAGFSALNNAIAAGVGNVPGDALFFSSSQIGTDVYGPTFWATIDTSSEAYQQFWDEDAAFGGVVGYGDALAVRPNVVPLPASVWLMLSGLVGVGAMARKRRAA
jgi:hypothetical protein